MTTVLLTDTDEITVPGARVAGEDLWLAAPDAEAATGWSARPEGLCRGPVCVPLPPGREATLVRGAQINLAGLWRHLGQPVVRSEHGDVWVLGRSAADRAAALASLEAPDFTLPDAAGCPGSLSEHLGKKVLLVTWASW